MFDRFHGKSADEIRAMNLRYTDFTATELDILIYETVMPQNDRAIANRFFYDGKPYERVADEMSGINALKMAVKSTSEKSVRTHREESITPALKETCVRLLPYWDREFERHWIDTAKIVLEYYRIKKELHLI